MVNPDGSITYITRALPLTAEEQAERDQLNAIMRDALSEMQRLASADYTEDEDTKRILDQWQATQANLIDDSVTGRTRAEEDALARRGLGDSSVGLEVRRKRALDELEAKQNLALQRDMIGNDVRTERLGLQQNLYNVASTQRDAQQAGQLQSAVRGQSAVAAINAQRSGSLLDYYNSVNKVRDSAFSVFSNAMLSSAGSAVGNEAVGETLGSIFKR